MPRFLDTHTGKFVWLADVGATPYAILSHTWRSAEEGGEQTYDDIVKLQRSTWKRIRHFPSTLPGKSTIYSLPDLSQKIKGICRIARNAGYRLIWIDSCCINNNSSAELSEAINSMYALYRDADICYVYLADVSDGLKPSDRRSEFWKSRWHARGWTLQELIAPSRVIFLSSVWTLLGTKTGLASTLEKITGVDAAILVGTVSVGSASVAKRMSWAAERKTTRVEDRAYSLLGIFGVHMSPIYGEGTNAFLRLQEEIIKHIPDQSIFAWGRSPTLLALDHLSNTYRGPWAWTQPGLLAASPDAFWDIGDVTPITTSEFATRVGLPHDRAPPPLHCVFTPQGARISLVGIPLVTGVGEEWAAVHTYVAGCPDCREAMARCPTRILTFLRCEDRDGYLVALPFYCPEEDVEAAEDVAIGAHTACRISVHKQNTAHTIRLPASVLKDLNLAPTWIVGSIMRHSETSTEPSSSRAGFSKSLRLESMWNWIAHGGKRPGIYFAPSCEEELRAIGFVLTPLEREAVSILTPQNWQANVTTTLSSVTRVPPHHEQQSIPSPFILIGLQFKLSRSYMESVTVRFSMVQAGNSLSAVGSVRSLPDTTNGEEHPPPEHASAADSQYASSVTTDHGFQYSSPYTIYIEDASSRVFADAEFTIPADAADCASEDEQAGVDYVRLLRLRLERPLDSAYVEGCDYLFLSIELSEPFKSTGPTTAGERPARFSSEDAGGAQSADVQDSWSVISQSATADIPPPQFGVMWDPVGRSTSMSPACTSKGAHVCRGPTAATSSPELVEDLSSHSPVDATASTSAEVGTVSHDSGSVGPSVGTHIVPQATRQNFRNSLMRLVRRPRRWILGRNT